MDDLIEVMTLGFCRPLHADAFSCVKDLPDGGASVMVDILGFKYAGVITDEMRGKLTLIRATQRLGLEIDSIDWDELWKQAIEPAEGRVASPHRNYIPNSLS